MNIRWPGRENRDFSRSVKSPACDQLKFGLVKCELMVQLILQIGLRGLKGKLFGKRMCNILHMEGIFVA